MKVIFAELTAPMFFHGINLTSKLDVGKRSGMALDYDRDTRELKVTISGESTYVPASALLHYTPGDKASPKPENKHTAQRAPVNAQVSDPSRDVQNPSKR